MTVRLIRDATLEDLTREMRLMLQEGIASPAVRRLAETAVAGKQDKISAVFDFIRGTFPYTPDPLNLELFVSPNRMAEDYFAGRIRGEDCDGLALLSGATLGAIGYETRVVLLDSDLDGELDHAIAQVLTPELGFINVDTSSSFPLGWYIPSGVTVYV